MTSKSFGAKNIDVSSDLNVSGVGTFTTGLKISGYLKDKDGDTGNDNQVLISKDVGGSQKVEWANLSAVTSNNDSAGIGFTDLNDTPSALGSAGQLVAVNSGATGLAFTDFSASNLGSGTLPSGVQIAYSQITDPITYQLKARKRNADDYENTTYTNDNPFLYLDSSDGSSPSGDDSVRLVGGDHMTITRDNNGQITFDSEDTIPGNGTITITQPGNTIPPFSVNQSGNTTINLNDTNTNYYLTNVSVNNPSSGGTASNVIFYRNDNSSFSTTTFDNLRVRYVYNYQMSNSPHGENSRHQFMLTDTITGYREVVTDADCYYEPNGDTAHFNNLNIKSNVNSKVKNFIIDHPLGELADAPKLRHSCIEGPELATFYRGKIQLVDGTATINIDTVSRMTDGTFVALNRNIQSFTTNETGWTQVKSSVSGNVLTIIAQDSNCTDTISWMVLGERKDDAAMEAYDENGLYNPENDI